MPETKYTLITGASGFIGNALACQLSTERPVVCLSRRKPQGDMEFIKGEFHSFEDLRQLDKFDISCVVHLAAVTGGCSEEDGLSVNVAGTRRLIRYLLDRDCRKFIMASSIAATGALGKNFLPLQLPIPDEHPCFAEDMYGLSKAMIEDLTRYFHRLTPDSHFVNLRIGAVSDTASLPELYTAEKGMELPFVDLAHIVLDDLLRAITLAVIAPTQPGVHVFNVVGKESNSREPIPETLRMWLGTRVDRLDLSWYERPEHAHDPLYAIDRIRKELGFSPEKSTRRNSNPKS